MQLVHWGKKVERVLRQSRGYYNGNEVPLLRVD